MSQTSEERFLDFINKQAEDVYPDPTGAPEQRTEAVEFSDKAQEISKDVKEGVPDRLLEHKSKSDSAERALVGNVLPQGETSSIQLKSVEKVSAPRSQTLMEQTLKTVGFL